MFRICLKNAFESSMLINIIVKMVSTRQDKDEIITLLADQLNDFKNKVIEEIKRNIFELLKEDIKKLNSKLLQTHLDNLKAQNTQLQERCSESENQIDELDQYSGRLCLRITGISTEEKETSDSILTKVKELIDESSANIPDTTVDCAYRIGKKKGKSRAVIVRFTTHRYHTLFYRARKKIKSGPKIHIDLTKKQIKEKDSVS